MALFQEKTFPIYVHHLEATILRMFKLRMFTPFFFQIEKQNDRQNLKEVSWPRSLEAKGFFHQSPKKTNIFPPK